MQPARIAGIVLAAGESSRMGQLKQLLPWQDTTLVQWQARQLIDAGVTQVVVVLGHEAEKILPAIQDEDVTVAINSDYHEGRASSLRAGASALLDPDAILICSVDQPRPSWLIRRLIDEWRATRATMILPTANGRGGHPTLLDGRLGAELAAVSEETLGLRAVVERYRAECRYVEVGADMIHTNLNTPEEYSAAVSEMDAGLWDAPPPRSGAT